MLYAVQKTVKLVHKSLHFHIFKVSVAYCPVSVAYCLHLSNVQLFPEIPVSEDTDSSVSAHTVLYVDNQLLMCYY